jgi:hypothetical protein
LPGLNSRPWGYLGPAIAGLALAVWACAMVHPAVASDPGRQVQAEHAYATGHYDQVAAPALGADDPAAVILNARAVLTKAMLMDSGLPEVAVLARKGRDLADNARHAAPDLVEPYLLGAIARGLLADHQPLQPAIANVREARVLIDTALRFAPNDPRALSTDAGWHLTLTGRLGTIAANLMFAASRSHGLEVFQRVFALLGDDPNTLYHYAKVRMLQSDADALPQARQALDRLAVLHPADALGQAVQRLAPQLLAAIAAREGRAAGNSVVN